MSESIARLYQWMAETEQVPWPSQAESCSITIANIVAPKSPINTDCSNFSNYSTAPDTENLRKELERLTYQHQLCVRIKNSPEYETFSSVTKEGAMDAIERLEKRIEELRVYN